MVIFLCIDDLRNESTDILHYCLCMKFGSSVYIFSNICHCRITELKVIILLSKLFSSEKKSFTTSTCIFCFCFQFCVCVGG